MLALCAWAFHFTTNIRSAKLTNTEVHANRLSPSKPEYHQKHASILNLLQTNANDILSNLKVFKAKSAGLSVLE